MKNIRLQWGSGRTRAHAAWLVPLLAMLALLALIAPAGAAAADFPEITTEERAFEKFPAEPEAPIVVLSRSAEFWMMDIAAGEASSRFTVRERRKVLTAAGVDRADVKIYHSRSVRLGAFRGRTVLPDGTVIPLPKDAKFRDVASSSRRVYTTSVAFPGVVPGAILDYSYDLRWDSLFNLDPYYFQSDVPVVSSEITYYVPQEIQARGWSWDPLKHGIQVENKGSRDRGVMRASAKNLPSIPDEPYSPPFGDMAVQMMLIPLAYRDGQSYQPLMGDWTQVSDLYHEGYKRFQGRGDGAVNDRARKLTAQAATPTAKAEVLYRFVRDEIAHEPDFGVGVRQDAGVGATLSKARGTPVDKALLLQVMLRAVKVDSQILWVADRQNGRADVTVPNPAWFDRAVLRLKLDGSNGSVGSDGAAGSTGSPGSDIHLDPSDRALAFGRLAPGYSGTHAVVFDRKNATPVQLPDSPATDNTRSIVVDLEVDGEGGVSGSGSSKLAGAHAWLRTRWREGETETREAWKAFLEQGFPDYTVSDVVFVESIDGAAGPAVEVNWKMKLREEKALPDEVTFVPSQPLGPTRGSDLFPGGGRRTPIVFLFADRDDVELRVRWPEGWRVEARPRPVDFANPAGAIVTSVVVDEAERRAVVTRRVDVLNAVAGTNALVTGMFNAYKEFEKSDVQTLLLVRR